MKVVINHDFLAANHHHEKSRDWNFNPYLNPKEVILSTEGRP